MSEKSVKKSQRVTEPVDLQLRKYEEELRRLNDIGADNPTFVLSFLLAIRYCKTTGVFPDRIAA